MIAGTEINTLVKNILNEKASKRDYIAETSTLKLTDGGRLVVPLRGRTMELETTDLCLRQIGDRVGIPSKYVERMRVAAPELLARNVNHWFAAQPEKRMVRALTTSLTEGKARAFLSERFRPLDNVDIAAHVLPRLSDAQCEVKSAQVTDTRLYIQAVLPKMQATIAKVGDVVQSGVVISNSEVGCGSLWIEHMVYTLRCTNGMIASNVVKRAHVGGKRGGDIDSDEAREYFSDATRQADDRAFWLKVQDLTRHALSQDMFDSVVANLNKTAAVEIAHPTEALEIVAEQFSLRDSESEAILKHYVSGGMNTQYGLLNAVTRTAEDLTNYDRAIELERIGGEIMVMKPSEFSRN
jgi:pyrroloquinoline quinone (PQQ) biosynthesis protein C